jgi:hypothetical protein
VDEVNVAYIHNAVCLAIKKNEIMSFKGRWVELEIIISSKESQIQRKVTGFLSYIEARPKR